jgi:glycosyltransferase involved in cell wall biosynthesis
VAHILYDAFYLEVQTFGMTRASYQLLRATAELFPSVRSGDRFSVANFSGRLLPECQIPGLDVGRVGLTPRLVLYGAIYLSYLSPIRHLGCRPDAVFWSNMYFFGKDLPAVRQAVLVHDLRCLRYPDTSYAKELWMTKAAVRRLRASRSPIAAPSGWTKKDLVEMGGIEPDRIHVVPHGIDPIFGVVADRDRLDAAAARMGLAGKQFIFYVGGFRRHKNLPMLLRAFRELRRRELPDLLLVLAGDLPPYLEQVFREAEYDEADRAAVRYLNYVSDEDLVVLYNLALCLAFPSRNEGFGLPVTEAMACGCPVVCSNATALPEVCGGAAVLLDPGDIDGWAGALGSLAGDDALRGELRRKGLARAAQLTWRSSAEKILALLA